MLVAGESYCGLKDKQRSLRGGFPESLGLRVHRAISWLGRAERERDDLDAAFIFYWIGFNAAYADERPVWSDSSERSRFEDFFALIVRLDQGSRIYKAIWDRFSSSIRIFFDNRYVFQPFWNHLNAVPGAENWEELFERSRRRLHRGLADRDTAMILSGLFARLYVLRNQIFHGGATWNGSVNRDQLRDGRAILASLLPEFIDLMLDHPSEDWGKPHFPNIPD